MGGGGKGKVSIPAPPPAPVPPPPPPAPVQEDSGMDKKEIYSSVKKRQEARDVRRATILTGAKGDESEAQVQKSTLLGA